MLTYQHSFAKAEFYKEFTDGPERRLRSLTKFWPSQESLSCIARDLVTKSQ